MTFFVYVLRSPEGRLYIGSTSDLEKRVSRHQAGEAGWTKGRGPWELVHYKTFAERKEAMRRERSLKSGRANLELHRQFGEHTVERGLPGRKD